MEGIGSPPIPEEPFSEAFFTPLVLSLAGIVSASVAIASFHRFLFKYCLRRLLRSSTTIISSSEPLQNLQFRTGVEEKILMTIPILPYSTKDDHQRNAFRVDQTECVICLGELEDGEMVRLLPNCRHAFHVTCIDNWFSGNNSCPICRSPLVEPIATFDFLCLSMEDLANNRNEEGVRVQDLTEVHGQKIGDDGSVSCSRVEPIGFLRHSVSSVFPMRGEPQFLATALKRSLSMDQYYVLVNIQSDNIKEESPSSSTRDALMKSRSYRAQSLSSRLLRSFSQLRMCRSCSTANEVLPYSDGF